MKVTKVALFGNLPAGTRVWLTKKQAATRAHLISEVETKETRKDRKLYSANAQLGFKAGEELAIEGDLDRGLERMFGIAPSAKVNAPVNVGLGGRNPDHEKAIAVAKAETDVSEAKAAFDAAQQNLTTAETDEAKASATAKIAPLQDALTAAEAALAALRA